MRILQATSLVVFAGITVAISVCKPAALAENAFLVNFVNHEYINVLSVIVTVSLVSITQIHLEYSRVERRFKQRVFGEARREINLGAFLLTSMLVLAFIISYLKAEAGVSGAMLSLAHGASLLTVLVSVFVMYDLIRTVYVLASDEPIGDDPAQEDGRSGS